MIETTIDGGTVFQDIITTEGVSTDLFAAIDNISTSIRTASSGVEAAKAEGITKINLTNEDPGRYAFTITSGSKTADFSFSGNDENTYEFNKLGGSGCISVSANVAPKICSDFHSLCHSKKFDEAKNIFDKLLPLHDVMFVESKPVPAKYSLRFMNMKSE